MNVVSFIILSIAIMLMLTLGIIFFVILYQRRVIRHHEEIKRINDENQRELIQASFRGEEAERMRIAAELHDDVGTTLASVRLFLHAAAARESDPEIIAQSRELLDESISRVRSISHKLQPALLQQLGLQASLESFAATISKPGTVKMEYSSDKLPRLSEMVELSIYRIIQELTTNIMRHSHANRITVETMLLSNLLQVNMMHNGTGLTDELFQEQMQKKGSIGLKNIMNRLNSIHASIRFKKEDEDAFLAVVTVPLPDPKK